MARVRPDRRRAPLGCEPLEERCTPATSGTPWPDGAHLTLSFVPDGTPVGGTPSTLHRTLDAVAPRAVWQRDVLRAFQAWAAPANLNVGVVGDRGLPAGATGAVQGDARFGDIRVSAVPLPAGTLATNTPFQWSGTTWSGDVVLNTSYVFGTGGATAAHDLFTVMLNEAGNVFGVTDTDTDPTSAVYRRYVGPRSGLSTADVADVRSLYGARGPDRYDAAAPNESASRATPLSFEPDLQRAEGDLSRAGDQDYYAVRVPGPVGAGPAVAPAAVAVKLAAAGISSLSAALEVYDHRGKLVGRATAAGTPGRDLAVRVANPVPGRTYFARVVAADGGPFGIGGYRLSTTYQFPGRVMQPAPPADVQPGTAGRFEYHHGTIADAWSADEYEVQAPAAGGRTLNAIVYAADGSTLVPKVEVFDAAGELQPARLLAHDEGTYAVELAGVSPGAFYTLKVGALYSNGSRAVGGYVLGAGFGTHPPAVGMFETYATGTLTAAANQAVQSFAVGQNRLYQFALTAVAAEDLTEVQADVVDAAGRAVFTLRAYAGMPTPTGHVYLPAGAYRVRYTAASPGGELLPTSYTLEGRVASDPIGPDYTEQPGGGGSNSGGSSSPPPGDSWGGIKLRPFWKSWDLPYYF